jgi:hypothetical protein
MGLGPLYYPLLALRFSEKWAFAVASASEIETAVGRPHHTPGTGIKPPPEFESR